jgi:hypothetical protein
MGAALKYGGGGGGKRRIPQKLKQRRNPAPVWVRNCRRCGQDHLLNLPCRDKAA